MTHSRELAAAVAVVRGRLMLEPLYTAERDERGRGALPGHDVDAELMERAGDAVADGLLSDFPRPRHRRSAARAQTAATAGSPRGCSEAGRRFDVVERRTSGPRRADVVVDALFGTGFSRRAARGGRALIERINATGATVVAVDVPSGVDASTGEVAGRRVDAAATVTFHGEKVGLRRRAGRASTRARSRSRTSGSSPPRRSTRS